VDFIERYFGISPDGGDGEVMLFVVILTLIAALALYLSIIRKANGVRKKTRNRFFRGL
jgi:hypothetical protein